MHSVLCKLRPVKDVSKEFRVTQSYISNICSKARKNKRFLDELAAVDEAKCNLRLSIKKAILEMSQEEEYMMTIKDIQ